MPEFLIYGRIVDNCKEVLSEDSRYWSDEMKDKSSMAPYWSADKRTDVLSKGSGQKKRCPYCVLPNCPEQLLYLRAIQGHSGNACAGNVRINPALQDNVLLPKDFTKYVCHVGNGKELRSIVHNGCTRRIQHQNRQTSRIRYRCESDGR